MSIFKLPVLLGTRGRGVLSDPKGLGLHKWPYVGEACISWDAQDAKLERSEKPGERWDGGDERSLKDGDAWDAGVDAIL